MTLHGQIDLSRDFNIFLIAPIFETSTHVGWSWHRNVDGPSAKHGVILNPTAEMAEEITRWGLDNNAFTFNRGTFDSWFDDPKWRFNAARSACQGGIFVKLPLNDIVETDSWLPSIIGLPYRYTIASSTNVSGPGTSVWGAPTGNLVAAFRTRRWKITPEAGPEALSGADSYVAMNKVTVRKLIQFETEFADLPHFDFFCADETGNIVTGITGTIIRRSGASVELSVEYLLGSDSNIVDKWCWWHKLQPVDTRAKSMATLRLHWRASGPSAAAPSGGAHPNSTAEATASSRDAGERTAGGDTSGLSFASSWTAFTAPGAGSRPAFPALSNNGSGQFVFGTKSDSIAAAFSRANGASAPASRPTFEFRLPDRDTGLQLASYSNAALNDSDTSITRASGQTGVGDGLRVEATSTAGRTSSTASSPQVDLGSLSLEQLLELQRQTERAAQLLAQELRRRQAAP